MDIIDTIAIQGTDIQEEIHIQDLTHLDITTPD